MELVDMQDLGSCAARRVGSSPFIRTTNKGRPSGLLFVCEDKKKGVEGRVLENSPVDCFPAPPLRPQAGKPTISQKQMTLFLTVAIRNELEYNPFSTNNGGNYP